MRLEEQNDATAPQAGGHVLLRDRIRTATSAVHERLDHSAVTAGLMASNCTSEAYLSYLKVTRGFVKPLEERLRDYFTGHGFPRGLDLHRLEKTILIESDLEALGLSRLGIAGLPVLEYPGFTHASECLGAMYVLEGSTMGGMVIAKHVRQALDYTREFGASFLSCYGGPKETVQRFAEFVKVLNTFSQSEADCRLAEASAVAAFSAIDGWFTAASCKY